MNKDEQSGVAQYRQHVQARITDEIKESQNHLKEHNEQLKALLEKLHSAKNQVVESVSTSKKEVHASCSTLLELLTATLTNRQQDLLSQLQQMEDESLQPLMDCEVVLNDAVLQTETLIKQGNSLVLPTSDGKTSSNNGSTPAMVTKDRIASFQKQAALNNCLPSVPELCSVACVTARFSESVVEEFLPMLEQFGSVRRMAPIQITHTEEKPGALLVCWEEVDDDDEEGESEHREVVLQCSRADESDQLTATFSTVYTGPLDRFLLQQLTPGCKYWLRVGHCFSAQPNTNGNPCSGSSSTVLDGHIWSLPRQCSTSMQCYRWQGASTTSSGERMWRVADCGRLACKEGSDPAVITSFAPQLAPQQTLTMQIVSGGCGCSDEGFALSWQPLTTPHSCTEPGSLFFSATGSVLVDGKQRLMQLPSLSSGSCVSFTLERADTRLACKLRVHIDTSDKQVTYEWPVPESRAKDPRAYFSACFAQPHWSVRVY